MSDIPEVTPTFCNDQRCQVVDGKPVRQVASVRRSEFATVADCVAALGSVDLFFQRFGFVYGYDFGEVEPLVDERDSFNPPASTRPNIGRRENGTFRSNSKESRYAAAGMW